MAAKRYRFGKFRSKLVDAKYYVLRNLSHDTNSNFDNFEINDKTMKIAFRCDREREIVEVPLDAFLEFSQGKGMTIFSQTISRMSKKCIRNSFKYLII